jgi:hypothetical protein
MHRLLSRSLLGEGPTISYEKPQPEGQSNPDRHLVCELHPCPASLPGLGLGCVVRTVSAGLLLYPVQGPTKVSPDG